MSCWPFHGKRSTLYIHGANSLTPSSLKLFLHNIVGLSRCAKKKKTFCSHFSRFSRFGYLVHWSENQLRVVSVTGKWVLTVTDINTTTTCSIYSLPEPQSTCTMNLHTMALSFSDLQPSTSSRVEIPPSIFTIAMETLSFASLFVVAQTKFCLTLVVLRLRLGTGDSEQSTLDLNGNSLAGIPQSQRSVPDPHKLSHNPLLQKEVSGQCIGHRLPYRWPKPPFLFPENLIVDTHSCLANLLPRGN